LPTMFNNSHNVYSATGAALQAALKLIVSRFLLTLSMLLLGPYANDSGGVVASWSSWLVRSPPDQVAEDIVFIHKILNFHSASLHLGV